MKFDVLCNCGEYVYVSAAQAGTVVQCECGSLVTIPPFSELRACAPVAKRGKHVEDKASYQTLGMILVGMVHLIHLLLACFVYPTLKLESRTLIDLINLALWSLSSLGFFLWAYGRGHRLAACFLVSPTCCLGAILLLIIPRSN